MILTLPDGRPAPLLLLVLALPLAAAVSVGLVRDPGLARRIALGAALMEVALALLAWSGYVPGGPACQLEERLAWMPSLSAELHLGLSAVSAPLIPATALLFLVAMVGAWTRVVDTVRAWLALLLLLEGCTIGVLLARDLALFFLFWELSMVPVYVMTGFYGTGPERRFAALKYALFMLAGGVPLLIAILMLGLYQGSVADVGLNFNLDLILTTPLPARFALAVSVLLALGFAVKAPLFPLHSWLPNLALQGPPSLVAALLGMKLGLYGLLVIAAPLVPVASWGRPLAVVAGISAIFGAVVSLHQENLRRRLAYLSVSHVGVVALAIAAATPASLAGARAALVALSISGGGLFLLAGALHQRLGSTSLLSMGGLARSAPRMGAVFLILALSSVGLPGTVGFVGEAGMLVGVLQRGAAWGAPMLLAMAVGAVATFGVYQSVFLGPVRAEVTDLRPRERWIFGGLALLAVLLGLIPGWWLTSGA